MKVSYEQWDAEYAGGRWDFLAGRHEQTRLAVIAAFIANFAPGEIIDLGGGTGELLNWTPEGSVSAYSCIDVSQVALDRIKPRSFPVEAKAMSLTDYTPERRDVGCVVASEVLYFVDDPALHLKRIVEACASVRGVAVSLVAPNPEKPNWAKASNRVWDQFDALGWPLQQSVHVHNHLNNAGWDLRFYLFNGE